MPDDVTLLRSIAMSIWFSSFLLCLFPLRFGFRTFPCFSFAGTLVGRSFFIMEKHRLICRDLYRLFRIAFFGEVSKLLFLLHNKSGDKNANKITNKN